MEVVIANWRVRDHPENSAYIMDGIPAIGAQLDQLRASGAERMYAGLRRACATPISIAVPDLSQTPADE
jgi:hypothetical protein